MKRLFDILFSSLLLVLLSPLFLVLAVLVKLEDGGPVFFCGERVGQFGKLFRMLKFRSMVVDAEKLGPSSTASDDRRITRIGKVLRRTKLDELPQLLNVLRGQMSFVGPRPQVQWAVDHYDASERHLLDVRPGITDFASIRFRNEAEILAGSDDPDQLYLERIAPEKNRLGLLYVRKHGLLVDLRVIWATIWAILGGKPELFLHELRREPDVHRVPADSCT